MFPVQVNSTYEVSVEIRPAHSPALSHRNHPLQAPGLDGLDLQRRVNGGLEQQLHAVLAQVASEPADLRGVARKSVLVVVHAAEGLPEHVRAP